MKNTLIILPAYNVEGELEKILSDLSIYKSNVVFIDDASTDKTYKILIENCFKVIRHKNNKGTSVALLTGLKYAYNNGYSSVILMDADGQHDPKYIDQFILGLKNYNIVLGNRFHEQSNAPECKWNSNIFAAMLFNITFGIKLTDVSCGFRAFEISKELIEFLEKNICKKYDIIYLILIYFLLFKRNNIGIINMNAIYNYEKFLYTPYSELESLIHSIVQNSETLDESIQRLSENINLSNNFQYIVKGITINAFYFNDYDGYTFQISPNDLCFAKKILDFGEKLCR